MLWLQRGFGLSSVASIFLTTIQVSSPFGVFERSALFQPSTLLFGTSGDLGMWEKRALSPYPIHVIETFATVKHCVC